MPPSTTIPVNASVEFVSSNPLEKDILDNINKNYMYAQGEQLHDGLID